MKGNTKTFLDYIKSTDNFILRILFMHLIFENLMDEIFRFYFKDGEQLRKFRFSSKVRILSATGIARPELINNLKKINELRNLIAHNLFIPHSEIGKIIKEIHFDNPQDVELNEKLEIVLIENSDKLEDVVNQVMLLTKGHTR